MAAPNLSPRDREALAAAWAELRDEVRRLAALDSRTARLYVQETAGGVRALIQHLRQHLGPSRQAGGEGPRR